MHTYDRIIFYHVLPLPFRCFSDLYTPARITSISSQEYHVLTQNELTSSQKITVVYHQSKEAICLSPVSPQNQGAAKGGRDLQGE